MRALRQLQQDFQQYLLRGDAGPVSAQVIGSERVPITTRLGIYGGAYVGRLVEALVSNYPALHSLMGEADFHALGEAYVRAHDSQSFSIRYYGDALADFLSQVPQYAEVPVLGELARWEWAMSCAFDAADAPALDAAVLQAIDADDWARLRFAWHPSVSRLDLNWNVPQLWRALSDEEEPPQLSYTEDGAPWVLWRQQLTTYFRSLAQPEGAALDAARNGATFGALCELVCVHAGAEAAPARAATLLRGWVEGGLISGVQLD